MPNLLPDWLPWIHPAGRLIWACVFLAVGVAFVLALMRRPMLPRPYPTAVGVALFFVVPVAAWVLGALIDRVGVQQLLFWLVLGFEVVHGLLMVLSRRPRDPEEEATWAEAIAGATAVFGLFLLAFGVIPHEWITFADKYLKWGTNRFLFRSSQDMLFFPWRWPFAMDYQALRDIVVVVIYVVFLGGTIAMWSMWQRRHELPQAPPAGTPVKRSRFGRPVRAGV